MNKKSRWRRIGVFHKHLEMSAGPRIAHEETLQLAQFASSRPAPVAVSLYLSCSAACFKVLLPANRTRQKIAQYRQGRSSLSPEAHWGTWNEKTLSLNWGILHRRATGAREHQRVRALWNLRLLHLAV